MMRSAESASLLWPFAWFDVSRFAQLMSHVIATTCMDVQGPMSLNPQLLSTACVWTKSYQQPSFGTGLQRWSALGPQEQRMLRNLGGVAPHLIDRGQERLVPSPWFKRWRPNRADCHLLGFQWIS